jgi:hypothetical protein
VINELQRLVDVLAESIDRPIAINDSSFRLIAHSSHATSSDRIRERSIIERQAPVEVVRWIVAHGVPEARSTIRTPAAPELDMLERVTVPLRTTNTLLGYLAILDAEGTLAPDQIAVAEETGRQLTALLLRMASDDTAARTERARLLERLLSDSEGSRSEGIAHLQAGDVLAWQGTADVVVVSDAPAGVRGAEDSPARLAAAIDEAMWSPRRGVLGCLPARDHIAVVSLQPAITGMAFAERLRAALATAVDEPLLFGVGDRVERPTNLHLAYRHARAAYSVAHALGNEQGVASWQELGADRVIASIPVEDRTQGLVEPALSELSSADGGEILLQTLDRFLARAGNVQVAAKELGIHRATLYERLHRIERETGLSLDDGETRLTLHLGIKLRRLVPHAGSEPSPGAVI